MFTLTTCDSSHAESFALFAQTFRCVSEILLLHQYNGGEWDLFFFGAHNIEKYKLQLFFSESLVLLGCVTRRTLCARFSKTFYQRNSPYETSRQCVRWIIQSNGDIVVSKTQIAVQVFQCTYSMMGAPQMKG